jgi:pyruvate,water dikinase
MPHVLPLADATEDPGLVGGKAANLGRTVLLPLAAGLATDVSGTASHCSLVAREYVIPAVMATGIATQVIRDGQLIRLDGSRGVVYL